jgi:hypothetical protein
MMKHGNILSISIAAAFLALLGPGYARAARPGASTSADNSTSDTADTSAQQQEAAQMVSARAHLLKTLDARKMQSGGQFEAILDETVHLKDGTELPHGTVLVGKVATDQMNSSGTSRLALQFIEAKLKDGKSVPVRAMIAGVAGPAGNSYDGINANTPPVWNREILVTDETGVAGDVDFHSDISAPESGEFITKKDNVKLSAGSQLSLAIAALPNSGAGNVNGGI